MKTKTKTPNNHDSMKTIVETFLIEETIDLIYDNEQLEKWNSHVEKLGLEGQTKIVSTDKSPIPFMHLKTSYKAVCETLCPAKVDVEQYSISPIPVEILDLIALSKTEGYFGKVQIWYDEKSPDPFAIGIAGEWIPRVTGTWLWSSGQKTYADALAMCEGGEKPYFSEKQFYLIGKWADVKRSWKELREMATERYVALKGNEYQKAIVAAKRGLEDLKTEAFDKFN
jgi:hypothetical protein